MRLRGERWILAILALTLVIVSTAYARSTMGSDTPAAVTAADDPTYNHAASALGLTASQAAVLAQAQDLGKVAKACQIAHGATPVNGGLDDPGGLAAQACKTENDANETFLNSVAFNEAMVAAQPRILAAAQCFESYTGIPPGAMVDNHGVLTASQAAIDAGNANCYRPNGLPK